MNIGLFTDTYFPQLSGVATSIQTLKNALEKNGHSVFIFTTTDPHLG
ncbi:glycosyltransferase family 4 protein, partial [Soehngenia saccharolytica]